ncbi:MAG TPA: hypothetical protein VF655_08945 [Allosphingosinicella sp.]|jgi:hypothetical protein
MDQALNLHAAFLRGLRASLESFAGWVLEEVRSRGWASANFRGARHQLALRFEGDGAGEAADALLAGVVRMPPEAAGQIVADLSVAADERRPGVVRIRLEALTVFG